MLAEELIRDAPLVGFGRGAQWGGRLVDVADGILVHPTDTPEPGHHWYLHMQQRRVLGAYTQCVCPLRLPRVCSVRMAAIGVLCGQWSCSPQATVDGHPGQMHRAGYQTHRLATLTNEMCTHPNDFPTLGTNADETKALLPIVRALRIDLRAGTYTDAHMLRATARLCDMCI